LCDRFTGGIAGGVIAFILVIFLVFFLWKKFGFFICSILLPLIFHGGKLSGVKKGNFKYLDPNSRSFNTVTDLIAPTSIVARE